MQSKAPPAAWPAIDNTFVTTLAQARKGVVLADLGIALRSVVAAVRETKKPGKLTLSITITPSGDVYALAAAVAIKCPTETPAPALFYADDDNNLVREDPDQGNLEFRAVQGGGAADETSATTQKDKYAA